MAKTEMIRARVEPELKREAEELFLGLGLSATEAITLFYRQVTLHRGLPFSREDAQFWKPSKRCDKPATETDSLSTPA